jgi:hypothetical protein
VEVPSMATRRRMADVIRRAREGCISAKDGVMA